jgi:hypothetical protein
MRRTPTAALAVALVMTTIGGCSGGDDAKVPEERQITVPSTPPPPTPALSPRAAETVLKNYLTVIVKANDKLDRDLAAKVETGSALGIHSAQYRVYRKNGLKYGKVKYTGGMAAAPKFSGYPKWFFAAATDTGTKPATRDVLVFVQQRSGAPWLVAYAPYSRTPTGPLAPGVDVEDFPAVVPLNDPRLLAPPGKLAATFVHAITHGAESPYTARFVSGRLVDSASRTLVDNRTAFTGNRWTGTSRAVAAKTPVYALRTKSGGALVWFGVDFVHSYRGKGGNPGMTWETSFGDLHKGFGLPSTIRSRVRRVERYELLAYVPPRGKGKIQMIASRWFPLSVTGS